MSEPSHAFRGHDIPGSRRVFIVDDHPLIRGALAMLIGAQPDLALAGEAEDAEGALEGIGAAAPDIALVDISLRGADGAELIRLIKARFPGLVVAMLDGAAHVGRALEAGADGYIMKRQPIRNVVSAIRRALEGGTCLNGNTEGTFPRSRSTEPEPLDASLLRILSGRELEVFRLMGRGRRIKGIAEALGISAKTVETHCAKASRKLGLGGTVELMHYAIRWTYSGPMGPVLVKAEERKD